MICYILKPLKTKITINIRRLLKYLISVIYISTYQKQKNKKTRKTISSKRKEKKLVKHYNQ